MPRRAWRDGRAARATRPSSATPSTSIRSLSEIGRPCSQPRSRPARSSASRRSASRRASSAKTVMNALRSGCVVADAIERVVEQAPRGDPPAAQVVRECPDRLAAVAAPAACAPAARSSGSAALCHRLTRPSRAGWPSARTSQAAARSVASAGARPASSGTTSGKPAALGVDGGRLQPGVERHDRLARTHRRPHAGTSRQACVRLMCMTPEVVGRSTAGIVSSFA